MDVPVHPPVSQDEFFAWAERQERRYEFDGAGPVLMTGGNGGHSRLICNINGLRQKLLDGTACESLGPEAGIATVGGTVRYPDALATCTPFDNQARLVPNPVAVFEVVSPTSVRVDLYVKPRDYAAVPSILHYVIVESDFVGVTVLTRPAGDAAFEADSLVEDGTAALPGAGIEFPVADMYRGVFAIPPGGNATP